MDYPDDRINGIFWKSPLTLWRAPLLWHARETVFPFVAVMTRAYPEDSGKQELILLQNISCYALLACGVVYIISGILCMGRIKRARQKKELSREQAVKDLQELEQRREELEALLLAEERT